MNEIAVRQKEFFNSQKTKSLAFRRARLNDLLQALKKHEKLLVDAIYEDFKKSEFDTITTELALLHREIRFTRKYLYKWARKRKVESGFLNFPASSYIIPEPRGVSLIIGAWNYPYLLSFAPAIAAIAAGNTVVLKPSELPENTSAAIAAIVKENFDPDFFTVVEGGAEETQNLLKQKFDKIFFTGSPQVGKIVYKAAAEQLTPVTLELGGKSPAIVTKDCNLKISVRRIVWGKFLNAGQTCIAPDYVLVEKTIEEDFLEQLKIEIENQKFSIENDNYVQIINDRHTSRLLKLIQPEKVFYGGGSDAEHRYIEPTVLRGVNLDDPIMKEEIFGPLLPVLSFESFSDAVSVVNSFPGPLSCYVFTKSKKIKKRFLNEISFGGGAINETVMHISNHNLPFGGVGESGIGKYHGQAGFETFSNLKSIMDKPTWFDPAIRYSPHSSFRLNLMRKIMKF